MGLITWWDRTKTPIFYDRPLFQVVQFSIMWVGPHNYCVYYAGCV